jgi:hypothetical protein
MLIDFHFDSTEEYIARIRPAKIRRMKYLRNLSVHPQVSEVFCSGSIRIRANPIDTEERLADPRLATTGSHHPVTSFVCFKWFNIGFRRTNLSTHSAAICYSDPWAVALDPTPTSSAAQDPARGTASQPRTSQELGGT